LLSLVIFSVHFQVLPGKTTHWRNFDTQGRHLFRAFPNQHRTIPRGHRVSHNRTTLLHQFLNSTDKCASNVKQAGGLLQYAPLSVQVGVTQVLAWPWRWSPDSHLWCHRWQLPCDKGCRCWRLLKRDLVSGSSFFSRCLSLPHVLLLCSSPGEEWLCWVVYPLAKG